jgi:hypothetical protein
MDYVVRFLILACVVLYMVATVLLLCTSAPREIFVGTAVFGVLLAYVCLSWWPRSDGLS